MNEYKTVIDYIDKLRKIIICGDLCMTIELVFSPTQPVVIEETEIERMNHSIISIPYLLNTGAKTSVSYDEHKRVTSVVICLEGLSVIDQNSHNMMVNIIRRRLKDDSLPFCLSKSSFGNSYARGDAVFLAERLRPAESLNSKQLAQINFPDTQVPTNFICSISAQVMDHPVYDLRAPDQKFEKAQLMFWLDQHLPSYMPSTRLPYLNQYIKADNNLMYEINNFVEDKMKDHDFLMLRQLFEKLKIPLGDSVPAINDLEKAFRRVALSGDGSQFLLLFKFGVQIDAQDDNPSKRFTALHWALKSGNYEVASTLLAYGARLNIPDANGITALNLIRRAPEDKKIQLLHVAQIHNLLPIQSQFFSTAAADRTRQVENNLGFSKNH